MMALETFVSERHAAHLLAHVRWRDGVSLLFARGLMTVGIYLSHPELPFWGPLGMSGGC